MTKNLLIVHGGGPTAVINASLYGAICAARQSPQVGQVYGALGGTAGVLAERFVDFTAMGEEKLALLLHSPATAIGTSRTALSPEDYAEMIQIFQRHGIGYVLFNGGNGSMDTCGKLYEAAKAAGISVVGIPKTIDNDIAVTDHCPGFGSAARYLAQTVAEIAQDVRAMPIHVCIIESMGRNAGWITGAAALAKTDDPAVGPHLIYLPEVAFDEEAFLTNVKQLYDQYGSAVVVASEGLKNLAGQPVAGLIFESGRSQYFGDVGAYLAELVIRRLGIKARSEKPGLAGRCSIAHQSPVDRDEAVLAGREACLAAVEGKTGIMIGFERISTQPYRIKPVCIPIQEVMLAERGIPAEFIAPDGKGVTPAFVDWCRPLIGGDLQEFVWFT